MAAREFKHRYKRDLNSKTYNRWIENKLKIRQSKFQSKKVGSGRKALFPDMEEKLNYEFLEMRDEGIKVKEWWGFFSVCIFSQVRNIPERIILISTAGLR